MAGIGTTNDFDISAANGVTTVFTYTFFAYTSDQVKVYSVLDDVETPITTGITITPNSDYIGGTVTFVTAPAAAVGDILRRREVDYTQTTEFSDITRYKEPAIEKALNILVMQIQQIYSKVNRALKYSEASGVSDVVIETPVADSLLAFDGITGRIKGVLLASLSLTGLDTLFSSLTAGDSFIYDGSKWVNRRLLALKGTSIASAATTDIGAANSDFIDVTGTTSITSLGATTTRNHIWVNFTGALTLTHNATSLILPSGANITTAAGDVAEFVRVSGSNWKCVSYLKADGTSVTGIADNSITYVKILSTIFATAAEIAASTASKLVNAVQLKAFIDGYVTTPWVAWTPTFTGFGTPTGVSFRSRRVGSVLEFEGVWTPGTCTAVEARISLGYNGTDGGITSASSYPSGTQVAGAMASALNATYWLQPLIEPSVGYITFGAQGASNAGLTKLTGSGGFASNKYSVKGAVQIQGW